MNKQPHENTWKFIDASGSFSLQDPDLSSHLYFPLANEARMLSVVTPTLNGDIKTDHNTYFSQPLSVFDLHNTRSGRNFWVYGKKIGPWSATGNSASQLTMRFHKGREKVSLQAGFLWHEVTRENTEKGLKAEITNFVPYGKDQVELMRVSITNLNAESLRLTPTAAVPIFGRSADNLRDHRHVTSLLNRITCTEQGVLMNPTLSFDERGHIPNDTTYGVLGVDSQDQGPTGFFPVLNDFIGEGGTLDWPRAIVHNLNPVHFPGDKEAGYESLGGLQFPEVHLKPGESQAWLIVITVLKNGQSVDSIMNRFGSLSSFDQHLAQTKTYWNQKLDRLQIQTGNPHFDTWMRWVSCQPILRRLYGNSFLPYHDYGRGGRGWRDLWQDILTLMLMEPKKVQGLLVDNFAGVRMDGSNATIIGNQPGEFKADRNEIARVWMDHGVWPWLAVKFYLDQTGDLSFLLKQQTYFKDHLTHRTAAVDEHWQEEHGTHMRTSNGDLYRGSILEHLLIQHLTAFFNVGGHNLIRLEDADWNDGLDMASDHGESAAFTALYAHNLQQIAEIIQQLKSLDISHFSLAEETLLLLDRLGEKVDYHVPEEKQQRLNLYFDSVSGKIAGKQVQISPDQLVSDLRSKADHLTNQLRTNEWIEDDQGHSWFNGYYDDRGQRLEGEHPLGVRMTLTGQVFQLMGEVADDHQAREIIHAVDDYLYDPDIRGYHLNTNFGEPLLEMGRAFGFAYGHKENGAVFNHMAVMYANALYQRGFIKEGFKVLDGIYRHSVDFPTSRIYPGIPEYFNPRGRGMYPYLTGSASWYLLTMITRVFGVRGQTGDLLLQPRLMPEQFDDKGKAGVHVLFASRRLYVLFLNPERLEHDQVSLIKIEVNGKKVAFEREGNSGALLPRDVITSLPRDPIHRIKVHLKRKNPRERT